MAQDAPPAPGLDALGRFVNRREVALLRPVLADGERVLYALEGRVRDKAGLLAATDSRIVWVRRGLFGAKVRSFPYPEIQEIHVGVDPDEAVVTLAVPGEDFVVARCPRREANEFGTRAADAARRTTATFRLVLADPNARTLTDSMKDLDARLARVDRMLERGSMTQKEHRVARRRLLEEAGLPTDIPDAKGRVSEGGRTAVRGEAVPGAKRDEFLHGKKDEKRSTVKRF